MYFAKNPLKQNICEKTQIEYCTIFGVNIRKPDEIVYLNSEGNLTNKKSELTTKSIDFIIKLNGEIYYGYAKYTKENGGSQDNQFIDAQLFAEYASKGKDKFYLLLDGDYYRNKPIISKSNNLIITTTDELVKWWIKNDNKHK